MNNIQNIEFDHVGTYWYTVTLGAGSDFAHDSALDALQAKRGDSGAAGFSGSLTYSETNWPGEFERGFVCRGIGFEFIADGTVGGTVATDAHNLAQNVNAIVRTSKGAIPLGPLAKWPGGESGKIEFESQPGNTGTQSVIALGGSSRIVRFAQPIYFNKGDKPKVEFHPGATAVNPTAALRLRTILIGDHI